MLVKVMPVFLQSRDMNVSNCTKKHLSKFVLLFLSLNVFGHESLSSGKIMVCL